MLLQRNLIYTGVTRGKRLVVLVGEPRALAMAVKNNRMQKRYTWLARRLGAAPESAVRKLRVNAHDGFWCPQGLLGCAAV